jgi:hypothetical protein
MMKMSFLNMVIRITVMVLIWGAGLAAASDAPDRFVFDLINQYRAAPYEKAVALGYDPAGLAEKGIFPETRFEPYRVDEGLFSTAADANARAAATEPVEPPPDPDRQHMIQTEAVLTFSNFIPMETAGTLFVRNLFTNELDTGEFRFILSSEFKHAGAAMDPGVLDGRNTWFTTLVLGSAARVADIQMLNLINQVRAEPKSIFAYIPADLVTDLVTLFQENQQIYLLPSLHFKPMFFDGLLYEMAKADVLSPETVSIRSDNRWALNTEVGEKTWPGEWFQSLTAAASWENMAETQPVIDLFTALLYAELVDWPYSAVIFSNHYTEAGAFVFLDTVGTAESEGVLEPGSKELEPGGAGQVTLCAGSAVPVPPLNPGEEPVIEAARIYGLLFLNQDDDTFYSPGEELAGETVDVYPLTGENGLPYDRNVEPAFRVVTDNAGHFSLSLEPGRQWVFEAWKDDQVSRRIIYIDTDQFVKMSFFPPDQF